MSETMSLPTGQNVAPTPTSAQPVLASGQTLTSATDTTVTVVSGCYTVTSTVGYCLMGFASVDTAANILFVAPAGVTILIVVPEGMTSLYYKCVGTSPYAFLRKVLEN
jgi:hypothetical protein